MAARNRSGNELGALEGLGHLRHVVIAQVGFDAAGDGVCTHGEIEAALLLDCVRKSVEHLVLNRCALREARGVVLRADVGKGLLAAEDLFARIEHRGSHRGVVDVLLDVHLKTAEGIDQGSEALVGDADIVVDVVADKRRDLFHQFALVFDVGRVAQHAALFGRRRVV